MITEHQQEQASLYAAGALSSGESAAFAAEMAGNPELLAFTRSLESTAALVARAQNPSVLPRGLKALALGRIGKLEAVSRRVQSPPAVPPGLRFTTAAASDGWKPLPVPGAFVKLLSLEPDRGYATLLGKLDRGARYPAHVHAGPEDFFILTGDLVIGDRKLVAGDFHHADAGSQHEENHSVEGCTLIAVLTSDDPLVALAMA